MTDDDNPYVALGDTVILSPTTVVDIRYGVTRISTNSSYPVGTGFNYSDYGMPAGSAGASAQCTAQRHQSATSADRLRT